MNILLINGSNMNILEKRESEHYGKLSYDDLLDYYKKLEEDYDVSITAVQSNIEGQIVNYVQNAEEYDALIINLGGYTHTSVSILDSLLTVNIPIVEVHLSNIHKRDDFRSKSLSARTAIGVITGFGKYSYELAVKYLVDNKNS